MRSALAAIVVLVVASASQADVELKFVDAKQVTVSGTERQLQSFCRRYFESLCGDEWWSHETPRRQYREMKRSMREQRGKRKTAHFSIGFKDGKKAVLRAMP